MKIATLKHIGKQEGFGRIPAFDLYNIVALSERHPTLAVGSTVTIDSVRTAGFTPRFAGPVKPASRAATYFAPEFL